jgi:serine O-acetyltransferase
MMLNSIEAPARDPVAVRVRDELSLLQLIREDIGCVRLRDPAARGELETLLTYPGVHAVIWHRLAHSFWQAGWRFPARLLSWLSRFLTNVDIHPGATIGRRFIDHGAGVAVGDDANRRCVRSSRRYVGGDMVPGRHPTLEDGVVADWRDHPGPIP